MEQKSKLDDHTINSFVMSLTEYKARVKYLKKRYKENIDEDTLEITDSYLKVKDKDLPKATEDSIKKNKKLKARSELGKPIYCIKAGNKKGLGKRDVRRAVVIAGVHGSEGTFPITGAFEFIEHFLDVSHKHYKRPAKEWRIYLIPLVNPDGFFAKDIFDQKTNRYVKENSKGININRDFDDEKSSEARAVNGFLKEFIAEANTHKRGRGPPLDLLIDLHGCHGAEYFIFKERNTLGPERVRFISKAHDIARILEKKISGKGAGERVCLRRHHYPKYYSEKDFRSEEGFSLDLMTDFRVINVNSKQASGFFLFNPEKQTEHKDYQGIFPPNKYNDYYHIGITFETQGEGPEFTVARYLKKKKGIAKTDEEKHLFPFFTTYANAKRSWVRNMTQGLLRAYDWALYKIPVD